MFFVFLVSFLEGNKVMRDKYFYSEFTVSFFLIVRVWGGVSIGYERFGFWL